MHAVITADDLPNIASEEAFVGEGPMNFRDLSRNCMARGKALYEGHAVAAVAATTQAICDAALDLIDVKYEVLPYVIDVDAAMADDAPILHDDLFTANVEPKPTKPSNIAKRVYFNKGDVAAGFKEADVIVEGRYTTEPVHQAYIEPHACICSYGADGQCSVYSSSQGHFMVRSYCAKLLGIDISNIRATPAEIGGGFGGKTLVYLEPLALAMSKKCGRPVKMQMTREEVFRASGPTSGATMDVKIGAKKDGTIVAAQHVLKYQAGAFPGSPIQPGCMCGFAMYDLPNIEVTGYDVVSNRREGCRLSCAGRAHRVVRSGMRDGRSGTQAQHGSDRAAREERCAQRHQDPLRSDAPEHRLPRHAGGGEDQRALEVAVEAWPGARHRLRLLVQHRRRVLGGGARGRGRHDRCGVGQPGYRRLARLHRHDGGRDAADLRPTRCARSSPTPLRSASPMSPADRA